MRVFSWWSAEAWSSEVWRVEVWSTGALLLIASLAMTGCRNAAPAASGPVESVKAQVVTAEQVTLPSVVRATGTLRAHESSTLSAQVMGRVTRVLVQAGDSVRAGQTLVVLDDATVKAGADQAAAAVHAAEQQQSAAQASADLAASTLARFRKLEAEKSVSAQEMDEVTRRAEAAASQASAARAQVAAIRAQHAGASAMLGYTRISAPFAGVVTARLIDPGAMAAPGLPLLQVDSAGALELQASVGESSAVGLHKGSKLAVTVDSLGAEPLAGVVSEIVPAADPVTHSFMVKIQLPVIKTLRAGVSASAAIPVGSKQAIRVKRSAIVQSGSLASAYVLDTKGIAQLRYVTTGDVQGDRVEVLSGLNGGDRLVDAPGDRELNGKRIEIQ